MTTNLHTRTYMTCKLNVFKASVSCPPSSPMHVVHDHSNELMYLRNEHGEGGVDDVANGREEDESVHFMQRPEIHERSGGRA